MHQEDVVAILGEMASLLEMAGANPFEIRAFRNAARSLQDWDGDLAAAVAAGTVTGIEGIGKGIGRVIDQLVTEGSADDYTELRSRFPAGLPELLRLSGIGPKKVKALWQELGVESLDALEAAAREGRVAGLRGFGAKTEARILKGIDWLRGGGARKAAPSAQALTRREAAPGREPAAPGTGRLRAGTSGYSYDGWKGRFYPEDAGKDDYLRFYASRLHAVEINNTFYRFPTEQVLTQWARQVPEDFRFAVKANQRITHRYRLKNAGEVTRSFVERCGLLGDRLGCILFQLPPDFARDDDRLAGFLADLPGGARCAIEFRHGSWYAEEVFARLAEHQVALVLHDGDDSDRRGTDVACPRRMTTNFTYVRLRRSEYDQPAIEGWRTWLSQRAEAEEDAYLFIKHDEDTSPLGLLDRLTAGVAPTPRKTAGSAKAGRRTRRTRGA